MLKNAIKNFPDSRVGSNRVYTMEDIAFSAFSVFFTQSPSFLAHQNIMQHSQGRNNGESIFGIKKLPTDNHIRKVLDHVPAEKLFPVFFDIFDELLKEGELSNYHFLGDQLLIAIDGTGHFSSDKLH